MAAGCRYNSRLGKSFLIVGRANKNGESEWSGRRKMFYALSKIPNSLTARWPTTLSAPRTAIVCVVEGRARSSKIKLRRPFLFDDQALVAINALDSVVELRGDRGSRIAGIRSSIVPALRASGHEPSAS
jgi:hypothetical protein